MRKSTAASLRDSRARWSSRHASLRPRAFPATPTTRFELEIRGDAKKALALARDNWKVQREPADLRILGQAALAADDAAALQAFNSWIDDTRLQDATLIAVRGAKR